MKKLLPPLFLLAAALWAGGCQSSSQPELVVNSKDGLPVTATTRTTTVRRTVQAVPDGDIDGVRYGEVVKGYAANRYIDPTDRRTMHERHVVYRVEQDPLFVLQARRRRQETIIGPIVGLRRPEYAPEPRPGEVGRELVATRRNTEGLTTAVQTLAENQQKIATQTQQAAVQAASNQAQLAKALVDTNRRLDAVSRRQQEVERRAAAGAGAAAAPAREESRPEGNGGTLDQIRRSQEKPSPSE